MAASIAWIDGPDRAGRWGEPAALGIPLHDRGLLLADGLFETLLVERGQPRLLREHLERWQSGAALMGMAPPPGAERVRQLAVEAVARSGIGAGALRLNWSRGGGGRGIEPPPVGPEGSPGQRFWLQLSAATPCFDPITVIVSATERRCSTSLLSRCKSFAYGSSILARRQARAAGADDALLASSAGGLCCGTTANLLVLRAGQWCTPPLASGCLPGVMRRRALELDLAQEAQQPIELSELASGQIRAALLINSLGCRPISTIEGLALAAVESGAAERFWRRLL
jgi:branched-subunit amino acid aminotransferase/4-amino-4-deoxychorismate lyase